MTDRAVLIDIITTALDRPTCEHDVVAGCIHCRAEWVADALAPVVPTYATSDAAMLEVAEQIERTSLPVINTWDPFLKYDSFRIMDEKGETWYIVFTPPVERGRVREYIGPFADAEEVRRFQAKWGPVDTEYVSVQRVTPDEGETVMLPDEWIDHQRSRM